MEFGFAGLTELCLEGGSSEPHGGGELEQFAGPFVDQRG
jgi:hypothetical protein